MMQINAGEYAGRLHLEHCDKRFLVPAALKSDTRNGIYRVTFSEAQQRECFRSHEKVKSTLNFMKIYICVAL